MLLRSSRPASRIPAQSTFSYRLGLPNQQQHLRYSSCQIRQQLLQPIGSSSLVEYLRALPAVNSITTKEVVDLCFEALQQQLGGIDDTNLQPGRRDPRLVCELTKLPGAAQVSPVILGQLLESAVVPGGYLDVEALAKLPTAVRVRANVLVTLRSTGSTITAAADSDDREA